MHNANDEAFYGVLLGSRACIFRTYYVAGNRVLLTTPLIFSKLIPLKVEGENLR